MRAKPYARLRAQIYSVFGAQKGLADAMGISLQKLSRLLNGRQDWTRAEIETASKALNIPLERIHKYFF